MFYILLILSLIITYYVLGTRKFDYWKKQKVVFEKPVPFLGNYKKVIFGQATQIELVTEIYNKYPKERYVGCFESNRPALLIRDPAIIKEVFVTNFASFHMRGIVPIGNEPLLKNLGSGDGDIWKLLRKKLTIPFSSTKIRAMSPLIVEKAIKFQKIVLEIAGEEKETDVKELMSRYTTEIVGSCGFGVDTENDYEDTNLLHKIANRIFKVTIREMFIGMLKFLSPTTFSNVYLFTPEIETNVLSLMENIMKQRNHEPSQRNDFIDLLLELRNTKIIGNSIEKRKPDGTPEIAQLEMDDLILAAQVFTFLAAGYETTSSTVSYTLHLLAFNYEDQKKCQEEIDLILSKHDNQITYDTIKDINYLELCIRESLRLYPSLGLIPRKCPKDVTLPCTNVKLEKGTTLYIPVEGLHHDEQYFEEPDKFKPLRVHPEKFVYLPFGAGPRACIGEKLGMLVVMAVLTAILSRCTVLPSPKSVERPEKDHTSKIIQKVVGGLPLLFKKRENLKY